MGQQPQPRPPSSPTFSETRLTTTAPALVHGRCPLAPSPGSGLVQAAPSGSKIGPFLGLALGTTSTHPNEPPSQPPLPCPQSVERGAVADFVQYSQLAPCPQQITCVLLKTDRCAAVPLLCSGGAPAPAHWWPLLCFCPVCSAPDSLFSVGLGLRALASRAFSPCSQPQAWPRSAIFSGVYVVDSPPAPQPPKQGCGCAAQSLVTPHHET